MNNIVCKNNHIYKFLGKIATFVGKYFEQYLKSNYGNIIVGIFLAYIV